MRSCRCQVITHMGLPTLQLTLIGRGDQAA
ncbi:protein of unknown function [Modestobacter italicus]|uniref:Uncharacterized protein n=1 Tax=Modestobacter italicus (strain DSM 44449 / CECT 9708 / BC 501) TaxID=2732864 RepID=I4F0J3_MODI5|nr:protein of unknown function [Modestobacter marinus]